MGATTLRAVESGADSVDVSAPARAMDGLRRLVRALRASNADAERSAGITSAQLFVLKHITEHPGGSLRDVIRRTLTTQSTASEVVGRLVDQGLVARSAVPHDRRRVALSPTPLGRQVVAESGPPIQDVLIAAFERLAPAHRTAIADGLAAWLAAADLGDTVPSMFFEPDPGAALGLEKHSDSDD